MLHPNAPRRLLFAVSAALLFQIPLVRSEEPLPAVTPGVDVLARGPIHEAFAQPADTQPRAGSVEPKEPPPPLEEVAPDTKPEGDNVQWIPGYWQWDDERNNFVWVSGFWRTPPPGRQWVPGHYAQVEGGYRWVPGFWGSAQQTELPYQPPPPEPVEDGPSVPAPSDDAIYNPGTWVYREARYLWRPGFWITYRPGWVWVPARYVWTPAGCLFVDGYWDYPLADRGLLFAPVYCDPGICFRPGFVFRPAYCLPPDRLITALFVRPDCHHYYVGDYFAAGYRRAGFTAFVDFRFGHGSGYDPLFSYYRAAHHDGAWERNLRGLYAGRFNGDIPRPPQTLVQQNTFVRNVTVNKTVNVANVKNVTLLAPVSRSADVGVPLTTVAPQQLTATREQITQARDAARTRHDTEARIVRTNGTPRPGDPARPVTLNLAKTALPVEGRTAAAPRPPSAIRPDSLPPRTTVTPPERVIRGDTAPPVRHDPPAPKTTVTPPPPVRHDPPSPPKTTVTAPPPPPVRHDPPSTPKTTVTPPPPPVRHDPPTTPVRHDPPPAPKTTVTPPPPVRHDPPTPKTTVTSPPPSVRHDPPPSPKTSVASPPPPVRRDPPPPKTTAASPRAAVSSTPKSQPVAAKPAAAAPVRSQPPPPKAAPAPRTSRAPTASAKSSPPTKPKH
jgi:hypothetical protein